MYRCRPHRRSTFSVGKGIFSWCRRYVCSLRVTFLKTFHPTTRNNRFNDTTITVSDLHGLPQHTDPGCRALLRRAILHDFQNAIGAPAPISQREIAAVHGVAFGLAPDAVVCARSRSTPYSTSRRWTVRLAADMGTLGRVPELVENVSLLHEPSVRSNICASFFALSAF